MGNVLLRWAYIQKQEEIQRSINHPEDLTTDNIIYRLAINQSADIGSLYDARVDCLLETSSLNISSKSITSLKTAHGPIIDMGRLEGKSLPEMIGIDKELRLSIYLKMIASEGISLLIKYPFAITKYTRFLSYYYRTKEARINDAPNAIKLNAIPQSIYETNATHVVTGIQSGIHVVVILQLSPKHEAELDRLLEKIKSQLTIKNFKISPDEVDLLNQFTETNIFSNISDIVNSRNLASVLQKITKIISNVSQHRALGYALQPIRLFVPSYPTGRGYYYYSLKQEHMDQIEVYLYQLLLARKPLKIPFDSKLQKLAEEYLKQQVDEVLEEILKLDELYEKRRKKYYSLVSEIRNGNSQQDTFDEMRTDSQNRVLLDNTCNINNRLNALKEKAQLINGLKEQGIEYWNVKQLIGKDDKNLETIEQKLLEKGKHKRIFCFDDTIEQQSSLQQNNLYTQLINESASNSEVRCVYADFSYCSSHLLEMKILPSKGISDQQNTSLNSTTSKAASQSSKPNPIDQQKPSSINFTNVLLLGESGVGKSTFINAIVNYLKFKSLGEACSKQPIVLMPVSFLMTVGDHFEERMVRFGEKDPNEDYNHPGQSVTQFCRSYVFTIGAQTKIRLIDTPGVGDTRGLDQDDLNMQHILSYIENLSHLNAICILLKPNEARLNVVFRSYFTRLLGFLGENVRDNIIFCFTNTRATFFAPGNTGPLLKKMLSSHSIKDIPFNKTNTFCFDNESFRYLVALRDGIEFDHYQTEEYERSWITSVNESHRLLDYICRELNSYPQNDWQSVEHAHFQIIQLIRPMLETIRNTMRNMISLDKSSTKSLMELHSTSVPTNLGVCLDCQDPELLGEFWILPDKPHALSNRCDSCKCDLSKHSKVAYVLTYVTWVDKQKPPYDEIRTNLDGLKHMITEFVYFFKHIFRISKETDPILSSLNRMIDEENYLCSQGGQNGLNAYLYKKLKNLKKEYEKSWTTSTSNQKPMTLSDIYKHIENVSENPTISQQLDAIKQTQEIYMSEQERNVS